MSHGFQQTGSFPGDDLLAAEFGVVVDGAGELTTGLAEVEHIGGGEMLDELGDEFVWKGEAVSVGYLRGLGDGEVYHLFDKSGHCV